MMKFRKISQLGSALVLSLSTLLSLGVPLVHAAATCTWTGAGADTKFSTMANWATCNAGIDGIPHDGDTIVLPSLTPASGNYSNIHLVDDLTLATGLAGVTISSTDAANYTTYIIDTLKIADGGLIHSTKTTTNQQTFLNFESAGTLTGVGSMTIDGGANLYMDSGTIAGDLTVDGSSTYVGLAALKVTGTIHINNGASIQGARSDSAAGYTVQKSSHLTFNPQSNQSSTLSAPLALGGGSGTDAPSVDFDVVCGTGGTFGCTGIATTWAVSSPVTLTNDALFFPEDQVTVNFTGSISGSAFTLGKDQTASGVLNLNPSTNDSKSTVGAQTNPVKTTTVSDDQSAKSFTVVANETLVVDGKTGFVSLLKGSTLMGGGQVGGLSTGTGSTLAPGHSPGCITSNGNIFLSGLYQVQIGGTDACTGYDQLKVTGTVSLDASSAQIDVTTWNYFVPVVGQSYTIIDNDAADAVTGNFSGIAEGGTYTNQGVTYSVTYKGGDGNDVVLTVTAVDASKLPKKPNTGFQLVSANPVATLAVTTMMAAALIVISRRFKMAK